MITAFRSELVLLNRARVWATASLVTIVFQRLRRRHRPPDHHRELRRRRWPPCPGAVTAWPLDVLIGPGGATAAVSWATFGFGFVLLLAAFTSRIGNEFARGTFRTALLHHPRPLVTHRRQDGRADGDRRSPSSSSARRVGPSPLC